MISVRNCSDARCSVRNATQQCLRTMTKNRPGSLASNEIVNVPSPLSMHIGSPPSQPANWFASDLMSRDDRLPGPLTAALTFNAGLTLANLEFARTTLELIWW
jgi:hypothetical protein